MLLKKQDKPFVWAHRGASGYAPENTLASFKKAIEMKADGIELDVQMTKDGQLVVIHDETVNRTSDHDGWVKDFTLEELKQFNFNMRFPEYGFQEIPTLKEVFELVYPSNLVVNVEIKSNIIPYPGIEELVMKTVNECGMKERVVYSSFNHKSCVKLRELDKDAYIGFLYEDGFLDVAEYVSKHGGNALHPALYLLQDPAFMPEAKKYGLDVNCWTINEKEHMLLGCKLGLTSIITNYPDIARNIVDNLG